MARLFFMLIIGLALFSSPAHSISDDITFPDTSWEIGATNILSRGPYLLPPDLFDNLLPPPPTNSSPQTRAELDEILRLQATARTPEQLTHIKFENNFTDDYGGLLIFIAWDLLDMNNPYPNTSLLLSRANKSVSCYVMRLKNQFQRARPNHLDPATQPAIPVPGHPAYPSGHATQSMTFALLLAELDPTRREIYIEKAKDIAYRRTIAGLHYLSDNKAGETLATAFVSAFLETEEGKKLLAAAQREFSEYGLIPPPKEP